MRIQYPGAIYDVMNRGEHQEAIFADARDRRRFLSTLGEALETSQELARNWLGTG